MKRILVLLICFLTYINVNAADKCETEEFNRLKSLAEKIEFKYEYKEISDKDEFGEYTRAVFTITANNLNSELEALIINNYYTGDYQEFKYNSNKTASIDGFYGGEKVTVTIKGYVGNACSGKTVLVKTVSLPYYNQFHNFDECKTSPTFKYCSPLLEKSITSLQFYDEYDKFIEQGNKQNDTKNDSDKNEVNGKTDYMKIIIIGAASLLIISIIIIIISQKRKRNQL